MELLKIVQNFNKREPIAHLRAMFIYLMIYVDAVIIIIIVAAAAIALIYADKEDWEIWTSQLAKSPVN